LEVVAIVAIVIPVRLPIAPSKRRALLQWAKGALRAILPWPMVAWCEGIYFAQFGEIELRMVKHLCRPDQDSIDVGANVGTYLHVMKRHSRRVYAFEPVPWLAQLLAKKFGRKIVVENVALSRETSTALLHIPVIDGTPTTGLSTLSDDLAAKEVPYCDIPVETRPLDEIYAGDVGFIKIDVEGHEHSVLQGAQRTIARCQPRVLVEAEERHAPGSVRHVHAFFRRLGYRGYFVFQRHLTPIESFDPERMQRSEDIADYTLGTPRTRFERYINNFLFLPPEEPGTTLARLEAALTKPAGLMPEGPKVPGNEERSERCGLISA
jgi:FkbM family methyltransferase